MAEAPENAAPTPPPPAPATSSPPPKSGIPPRYDLDAKWDACLDLSIRRVAYSSLGGAFAGLLLFRSPTTRWASVALGAGVGIGAAYTECSYLFNGAPPKWSPKVLFVLPPQRELCSSSECHLSTLCWGGQVITAC
ncbi:hypothetical protein PVAP13_9NG002100 [Panicum virgatum]|uniref:Uncharacterized protein n=1 Tax=Panicum virgatum TaxID=38727 RepID=A0A8T0MAL0_PANVG|nr:hypothetical protein PVAP13_9NG002100 [Panicum virgatum]